MITSFKIGTLLTLIQVFLSNVCNLFLSKFHKKRETYKSNL